MKVKNLAEFINKNRASNSVAIRKALVPQNVRLTIDAIDALLSLPEDTCLHFLINDIELVWPLILELRDYPAYKNNNQLYKHVGALVGLHEHSVGTLIDIVRKLESLKVVPEGDGMELSL